MSFNLWRVPAAGGPPEQLTHHDGLVVSPAAFDESTMLYVAEEDGSGPWLWAFDMKSKTTRRISSGLDKYLSISATADGRRLVASIANPVSNLFTVPIQDRTAGESDVRQYVLPNTRALAPRFSGDSLFYLSSLDGRDSLWRWKDGQASEIWKGSDGPLLDAPGFSPDGRQVAIVLKRSGKKYLRIISADGSDIRPLIESLAVLGSPAWSPDGKWIVTGGNDGKGDGLFKVPVEGGAPVRLATGIASNPTWSAALSLIVYAGPNVAASQPLQAVRPDGSPVDFPAVRSYGEDNTPRFLPGGKSLIYTARDGNQLQLILLDPVSRKSRVLASVNQDRAPVFDISPDGKQLVFDRRRENADIVLIDRPKNQ